MMTLISHNNKTIYIIEVKKDMMHTYIYIGTINLQTTVIDEDYRDVHSLFKIDYKIVISV